MSFKILCEECVVTSSPPAKLMNTFVPAPPGRFETSPPNFQYLSSGNLAPLILPLPKLETLLFLRFGRLQWRRNRVRHPPQVCHLRRQYCIRPPRLMYLSDLGARGHECRCRGGAHSMGPWIRSRMKWDFRRSRWRIVDLALRAVEEVRRHYQHTRLPLRFGVCF